MATTPNIGLYKPNRNDETEVDVDLASNFEIIDTELTNIIEDVNLLKTSGSGSSTPAFIDGGSFFDTYSSQKSSLDGGEF